MIAKCWRRILRTNFSRRAYSSLVQPAEDTIPIEKDADTAAQVAPSEEGSQELEAVQTPVGETEQVAEKVPTNKRPPKRQNKDPSLANPYTLVAPYLAGQTQVDHSHPSQLVKGVRGRLKNFEDFLSFQDRSPQQLFSDVNDDFIIRGGINLNRYWPVRKSLVLESAKRGFNVISKNIYNDILRRKDFELINEVYKLGYFDNLPYISSSQTQQLIQIIHKEPELGYLANIIILRQSQGKSDIAIMGESQSQLNDILNRPFHPHADGLPLLWKMYNLSKRSFHFNTFYLRRMFDELSKVQIGQADPETVKLTARIVFLQVFSPSFTNDLVKWAISSSRQFSQLVSKWSSLSILMSSLLRLALKNGDNLQTSQMNAAFTIFETACYGNHDAMEIIYQKIPEELYKTKTRSLYESYRISLKHWDEKRAVKVESDHALDREVKSYLDNRKPLPLEYQGPSGRRYQFELVLNNRTVIEKEKTKRVELDEKKMIEELMQGDYTAALKHFSVAHLPFIYTLKLSEFENMKQEAKGLSFDSQNSKALYLLKELHSKLFEEAEGGQLTEEFLAGQKDSYWINEEKSRQGRIKDAHLARFEVKKPFMLKRNISAETKDQLLDQAESQETTERIYRKPKEPKGERESKKSPFFQKRSASFCTASDNAKKTAEQSYASYREAVKKQTEQSNLEFLMNQDTEIVQSEIRNRASFEKPLIEKIISLPSVSMTSGLTMAKFIFLKLARKDVSHPKEKLKVFHRSSLGDIDKDYSTYLDGCPLNYSLPPTLYLSLLEDQVKSYHRADFKRILSHLVAYNSVISQKQAELIRKALQQSKSGFTAFELLLLCTKNKVTFEKGGLSLIAQAVQMFSSVNEMALDQLIAYSNSIGRPFQPSLMSYTIRSLTAERNDEKLKELYGALMVWAAPQIYKPNPKLTAQQNIAEEKEWKIKQHEHSLARQFSIIKVYGDCTTRWVSSMLADCFESFMSRKADLTTEQFGYGLIALFTKKQIFREHLSKLLSQQNKLTITLFPLCMKVLKMSSSFSAQCSKDLMDAAFLKKRLPLTEENIDEVVRTLFTFDCSTSFPLFMEYLLRELPYIPVQSQDMFYSIINKAVQTDSIKNNLKEKVRLLFTPNRQAERLIYQAARIEEENKERQLKKLLTMPDQPKEPKSTEPKSKSSEAKSKAKDTKPKDANAKDAAATSTSEKTPPPPSEKRSKSAPAKNEADGDQDRYKLRIQDEILRSMNEEFKNKELRVKSLRVFLEMYGARPPVDEKKEVKTVKRKHKSKLQDRKDRKAARKLNKVASKAGKK